MSYLSELRTAKSALKRAEKSAPPPENDLIKRMVEAVDVLIAVKKKSKPKVAN